MQTFTTWAALNEIRYWRLLSLGYILTVQQLLMWMEGWADRMWICRHIKCAIWWLIVKLRISTAADMWLTIKREIQHELPLNKTLVRGGCGWSASSHSLLLLNSCGEYEESHETSKPFPYPYLRYNSLQRPWGGISSRLGPLCVRQ